jgi:hypothetical protein
MACPWRAWCTHSRNKAIADEDVRVILEIAELKSLNVKFCLIENNDGRECVMTA